MKRLIEGLGRESFFEMRLCEHGLPKNSLRLGIWIDNEDVKIHTRPEWVPGQIFGRFPSQLQFSLPKWIYLWNLSEMSDSELKVTVADNVVRIEVPSSL